MLENLEFCRETLWIAHSFSMSLHQWFNTQCTCRARVPLSSSGLWCTWRETCAKPRPWKRTPASRRTCRSVWIFLLCIWVPPLQASWVHKHTLLPPCPAVSWEFSSSQKFASSFFLRQFFLWCSLRGFFAVQWRLLHLTALLLLPFTDLFWVLSWSLSAGVFFLQFF